MTRECTRNFNRYECESECEVRIDSEVYSGKAFSFSDGVGLILEQSPQLEKGTRVDIKIFDYEIEFEAEVAWTKKEDKHIRAGFKRLGNFKGNLKHYRLPDIFVGISRGKKTGVLEITSGTTVKKIFIKNGDKLFAASNNKDDRLGEYLLKQGKISLEQFNQASYLVIKTGQRLGKVLVDLGYLKANELYREVQNQIEEIIVSLFLLEEGEFEFKEGPLPKDESITLQISSASLIYRGIKKINNFVHVKKMCPSVDTVFYLSANTMNIFKTLSFEEHDKKILSLVNGVNSLKTILALSPATNFATIKTICTLLSIGLIHIKGNGDNPQKLPITKIFGDPDEEVMVKFRETIPEVKAAMNKRGDARDVREERESVEQPEEKVIIIGDEESTDEDIYAAEEMYEKNKKNDEMDEMKDSNRTALRENEENCDNCADCSCAKDAAEDAHSEKKNDISEIISEETGSDGQPEEKVRVQISYSPIDGTVIENAEDAEESESEKAEHEGQTEEIVSTEVSCSPECERGNKEPGRAEESESEKAEPEEQPEEEIMVQISYSPIDGTVIEDKENAEDSVKAINESEELCDEAEADEHKDELLCEDNSDIEEISEELYGPEQKNEMKELHSISCPDAEAVMEDAGDLKDTFRKPEPVEVPEETIAASGAGGSVYFSDTPVKKTEAYPDEDTVLKNDKASAETIEENEREMVSEIADNAVSSGENQSGKKRLYVYAAILFFVLTAAGTVLVYYNINVFDSINMVFSKPAGLPETAVMEPVEKTDVPVVPKAVNLPSLRNEIMVSKPHENPERTPPFPTFREEALKRFQSE